MRLNMIRDLEGRLTYANVIATLALFFALTGGAWAATSKYLMASDPITQGDLAGSTYGNPVIATGKITTVKFNSSAIAPNADKLDGEDSTAFASIIGTESVSVPDIMVDPARCFSIGAPVPAGTDASTDFVVAHSPRPVELISVTGDLAVGPRGNVFAELIACNGSDATASIGGTYRYVILR